jgi:hypothetical protein
MTHNKPTWKKLETSSSPVILLGRRSDGELVVLFEPEDGDDEEGSLFVSKFLEELDDEAGYTELFIAKIESVIRRVPEK